MKLFFRRSKKFYLDWRGVGISILYMVLGGWWILITDDLAKILSVPKESFSTYHTIKGWAYIFLTGFLLYILLYYNNRSLRLAHLELEQAYDATIDGWSHALDLRDKETEGHTKRVTEITLTLARIACVDKNEIANIKRGALLHDIGKMGVSDYILHKPDILTEEERILMQKHPVFAFELLSPIQYLNSAAIDIPYCHHEKWDGTGYPQGLIGEDIPFSARLFSVVDTWDALTSDRPYRSSWSKEKALDYISNESGKSFDPSVVQIFLQMIRDDTD
jgi:HD-GYP domain-containing protein (c-di-GMP phosphodiesterase class II)